jgi:hypothetical protein
MMFERDPEEVGPEHPDDVELRMDTLASVHTFDPDPVTGKCREYLVRHGLRGVQCNSRDEWSVFHDKSDDPRSRFMEGGSHWHGGGDCMCFENDPW